MDISGWLYVWLWKYSNRSSILGLKGYRVCWHVHRYFCSFLICYHKEVKILKCVNHLISYCTSFIAMEEPNYPKTKELLFC